MSTTTHGAGRAAVAVPTSLSIRIQYTPMLPMIRMSGELDVDGLAHLSDAIDSIAGSGCPAPTIALHLAGVTFCDTAGVRAISQASRRLNELGKELVIYSPSRCIVRIIERTGIGQELVRG